MFYSVIPSCGTGESLIITTNKINGLCFPYTFEKLKRTKPTIFASFLWYLIILEAMKRRTNPQLFLQTASQKLLTQQLHCALATFGKTLTVQYWPVVHYRLHFKTKKRKEKKKPQDNVTLPFKSFPVASQRALGSKREHRKNSCSGSTRLQLVLHKVARQAAKVQHEVV